MEYLPGTTVEVNENNTAQGFLDSAFVIGGLVLSQIVQLTELEPHTVQNWVKRKFISPPVQKKYDCNQFCRIAIINMLKDTFNIERIVGMLNYAGAQGGADDMTVYIAFSNVITALPDDAVGARTDVDEVISAELNARSLEALAKKRLHNTIRVMVMAYISARIGRRADLFLKQLEEQY